MAEVIRTFRYPQTAGRGRGILGLTNFQPCRKPGHATEAKNSQDSSQKSFNAGASSKLIVALYDYAANPDSPGGFVELSLKKGQLLEFLREHPENEHWWEVRNEDGESGFVPSSYVLIREEQALPWLQLSALKSEEMERKERVKRLVQQQAAAEGKGFGPAPKSNNILPKPYVSAYGKQSTQSTSAQYYCEVCNKQLNGPKPYQAHMASRAHKEELELLEGAS